MQQIDQALLSDPKLSAEQLAEVKKLRAEGEPCTKQASINNPSRLWTG